MTTENVMDGYVRVSVVGGRTGDRFQSPDAQREAIAAWANLHGVTIAMWHEDLDQSGGTMDRPGIRAIRERIDQEQTGGIVVARLDRFARTLVGGLTVIRELHEQGARVVSVSEAIDPATPMGRAMLGLLLLMAEWHRDQADEHLAASQQRAASAGRFPGRPPYGYRKTTRGFVEVDEDTAAVAQRIFRERAAGVGWREIARDLEHDSIPSPTGRQQWARSTLYGIIQSEGPLGVFVGMRGLRVEDAWPAIVDRDLWLAANAVKGVRDNDRVHHDRLVAGLARCAGCRHVLVRTTNPEGYVSYGCTRSGCDGRASIGAVLLDEHVRTVWDQRFAHLQVRATRPRDDGEGQRVVAARAAAQRELDAWVADTEMRQRLGDRDWRKGMNARIRARDDAEMAVLEHETRHGVVALGDAPGARSVGIGDMAWERQREAVQRGLHSVWVRRSPHRGPEARRRVADRVRIVWRDSRSLPVLPAPSGPVPGPLRW